MLLILSEYNVPDGVERIEIPRDCFIQFPGGFISIRDGKIFGRVDYVEEEDDID